MPDENTSRLVQSSMTSLRVLEFVREKHGARLTDVAKGLDIGHSTAHNHLATLEEQGWLVEADNGYEISYRFLHYGRSTRHNTPFFRTIRRHANELSERTDLEVEFLVEENGRLMSLIDIRTNVAGYSNADDWGGVGIYYYMNNTASGKAILAEMPHERVEAILDRWGLPAQTSYSITDREVLYQQLETTRQRGYATAHQEVQEGFENAAVVVKAPEETILGAISIGWPSYLFDDGPNRSLITQLKETKQEIESEIAQRDGGQVT